MDSLTKPPTGTASRFRQVAIPLAVAGIVLVAITYGAVRNIGKITGFLSAVTSGLSTSSTGLPVNELPAETPESRDRERYSHANLIRIALNTYERDVKTYPANLIALVPEYLTEEPTDPSTGQVYAYVTDAGGYTLTFTLESGIFALSAGDHTLTPKGFDIPSLEVTRQEPEQPTQVTEIPAPPSEEGETPESPLPPPPPEEPIVMDADGDGLSDDQESQYNADPNKSDTDGDGLTDFEEAKAYGSDPSKADTDGDGFSDGAEVKAGYSPIGSGKLPTP